MSRSISLAERRRALLARSDAQREDIAHQLTRLQPGRQIMQWSARAPRAAAQSPMAWAAAAAGLLFLLKPRRLVGRLAWLAGVLSILARAGRLLRLVSEFRALRAGTR